MLRRVLAGIALLVSATSVADARPYNDVQIYRTEDSPNEWLTPSEYKALVLELGLIVSPRVMAPSSTLGFNGFDIGFEANTTLIHGTEAYWTKGTKDGSIPRVFTVPTLRVRKGLPLSFEGGMSVSYLPFTGQQVLGGDARWALHEGFTLVPDVAIQGSYSQYIGNEQLDMNVKQISTTLGYTWAFGEVPGIHTGRVSVWSGFARGYIDSQINKGGLNSIATFRQDFLDSSDGDGIGVDANKEQTTEYNKWVLGVQVESGGFTYLVNTEFVDSGVPSINMRWGAQF